MKLITLTLSLVLIAVMANAQIEVGSNNNVGIGISGLVNSKLSINHVGASNWVTYISQSSGVASSGALAARIENILSGAQYGLGGYAYPSVSGTKGVGVRAYSYSTVTGNGKCQALGAYAGNGQNGYNYAVFGELGGTQNGAAVFGSLSGEVQIPGLYAGYFLGDTKVVGTFWATSVISTSDENSKKDVKYLEKNAVANLKKVKAIKYKYKTPFELGTIEKASADTMSNAQKKAIEKLYEGDHIGLVAQEVEAIYPELVKTDASGMKGVDYTGLIPVLIEAIKEQQATIEALTVEVNKLKKSKQ